MNLVLLTFFYSSSVLLLSDLILKSHLYALTVVLIMLILLKLNSTDNDKIVNLQLMRAI